jgi:hypothetical protein
MKSIFVFLILLVPVIISAQTVQLRGKVIDVNKKPVKNLSIRFTSFGEAVTTGSGEFVITIPQNVNSVDIVIADDTLQILYPVDVKILVPADPSFVTTIIVSGSENSGETGVDETIVKFNELESLLKEVGTTNTELKIFLEKFIELESKRLEISETKLREEFERKDRRDVIFSEISPALKEYILRLKNLKTNFEMFFESAFVSDPSVEHLNLAIRLYNPSFDMIYNNQNKWLNEIKTAWNEVLSENYSTQVNYMIDEVHTPYVLQLNECLKILNEIRLKIIRDNEKTEELKREVRIKVSEIMKNLVIKIPILEKRFNELVSRLQHSEIN